MSSEAKTAGPEPEPRTCDVQFQFNLKRKTVTVPRNSASSFSLQSELSSYFDIDSRIVAVVDVDSQIISPIRLVELAPNMFNKSAYTLVVDSLTPAVDDEGEVADSDSAGDIAQYLKSPMAAARQKPENSLGISDWVMAKSPATQFIFDRKFVGNGYANTPRTAEATPARSFNFSADADSADDDDDGSLGALLARYSVFDDLAVTDLMGSFSILARSQRIDKDTFTAAFLSMTRNLAGAAERRAIAAALCEAFEDTTGDINVKSATAAMTFLCQGAVSEKINAAFTIFAAAGDRMTFEELTAYLESFMRISFILDPAKHESFKDKDGSLLSPFAVGRATASHCFSKLKKQKDSGVVEIEEFETWFAAAAGNR